MSVATSLPPLLRTDSLITSKIIMIVIICRLCDIKGAKPASLFVRVSEASPTAKRARSTA